MVFVVGWVLVLLLLAVWSGVVWAGQALLAGTLSHVGAAGAGEWRVPDALSGGVPAPWAEWLAGAFETVAPLLQGLVGLLPAVAGGITVLAWVTWGLGAALLIGAGVALHVAVALWRKARPTIQPRLAAALR